MSSVRQPLLGLVAKLREPRFKKSVRSMRSKRIALLESTINEVFQSTYGSLGSDATNEELQLQSAIFYDQTDLYQNELTWLTQQELREELDEADIAIPPDLLQEGEVHKVITQVGVAKLKRQLRKYRRAEAKEWISIFAPVWSAVIAILSLLVALKRR